MTDVIATWIDDESSLFELESGDNLISATDEERRRFSGGNIYLQSCKGGAL
ncbi:MAG: hypothetical protein ACLS4A_12875 [Oscillospiraceae bacterium]